LLTNRIPVIGVTGFHDNALVHWGGPYRAVMCETTYTDALRSQGALPVVLTADVLHVGAIIDLVDALLLTGGPDISPSLYGQARESHTRPADHVRDDFEIALVRAAFAAGTPILGICRGMQMLNVALGGSLIQHIDGHLRVETPAESVQPIAIIPGTRLHALLGVEQLNVNSLHHQAIGSLAPGLAISASAADDVVEAVEHEDAAVLGVQWHPETLNDSFTQKALISWLLHHSAAPAAA
jgi:putative glutamine amidotransferase